MKRTIATGILVIVGVLAWQIGSKLSADAIGMGVGVLFGVMAGIPTATLFPYTTLFRSRKSVV